MRVVKARRWKARSRCAQRANVPRRLVESVKTRGRRMRARDRTLRVARHLKRGRRRSGVNPHGQRMARTGIGARPRRERRRRVRLPRARVVPSRRSRPSRSRLPRRALHPSHRQRRRRLKSRRSRPRTRATGSEQWLERSGFSSGALLFWAGVAAWPDYYSVASVRWQHCPSPISHLPPDR